MPEKPEKKTVRYCQKARPACVFAFLTGLVSSCGFATAPRFVPRHAGALFMYDSGRRALIAAAAITALLAGAQLLPVRPVAAMPAPERAPMPVAQAETAIRSVVTVYAERAVSQPVMVLNEGGGEGARNSSEDQTGWSWRSGSGFAVAEGGYVLTNFHVISGARRIEARLANGRRVAAELIGTDPLTDLALLRVQAELPVLEWGDDAALRLGAPVLAVGSPLDFHLSVSSGVIGGFARAYDGADPVGYIQHDAALNPGNSGGPLIDGQGRVVGVNTAIPQEAFFNVGISLAIPADIARQVAATLLARGQVERGYLGLTVRTLHGPLASAMGRQSGEGVLIEAVDPDSPAADAGIRAGQTLLAVNGIELSTPRDLARVLLLARPGESAGLSLHDGQARYRVEALLDRRPEGDALATGRDLGFEPASRRGYGISFAASDTSGVQVASVVPGSPAAQAGLREGDTVLAIGATDMTDPDEAQVRLMLARRQVALRVLRGGDTAPRYIALALDEGTAAHAPDHAAFADASGGPF
jgi:serine protease Do